MLRYILKDILDCPVDSRFIVCVVANGANLERGNYYAEKALTFADELKWAGLEIESWRMIRRINQVNIPIKMKNVSRCQFVDAF